MFGITCIGIAFVLLAALTAGVCGIVDDRRSSDPDKKDPDDTGV